MKKKTFFSVILVIGIVIVASVYSGYTFLYLSGSPSPAASPTPTDSPSPTISPSSTPTVTASPTATTSPNPTITPTPTPTASPTNITVTDGTGRNVTVTLPVTKIISLNDGLTQMLCALGVEDKLVGRDSSSTMPASVLNVAIVGDNSYSPNIEVILELEPDVIFADSMLPYNDVAMSQLEAAGIPVFISDTTDPEPEKHSDTTAVDFSCTLMSTLASIVGNEDIANDYVTYVQYYNNLVKERVATLNTDEKSKVMLEWYSPYNTYVTPAIDQAGGINIAENQTSYAPVLSAEFVVEQNPALIIRLISSITHTQSDFQTARNDILTRTELSNVDAIKNGKVFICDYSIKDGIYSVVGYLYWATWCQPDLFTDINPNAVMTEISQHFFGDSVAGVYIYP